MRLALIGADFEENLGIGMIAAAAEEAGHKVTVIPFNQPSESAEVVTRTLAAKPDVVGLGIQFQHRAHEFLALSARLRAAGFAGHITAGGQYPTLAWQETLSPRYGIDTVVLHDGEDTITELMSALRDGRDLRTVAGLALRDETGAPMRTAGRRLRDDLDALPFARRYRGHTKHMGVPFVPIMASRGCWGSCTYCSITSFYRDARNHGGGRTVRTRSPANVAREMAALWHSVGGDSIFCFHDDNFLLPKPDATLERLRAIRKGLDAYGVGRAAMIGKCRPETLTHELAKELRSMGVLRLYVGVENASEHGACDLNRATQWKAVDTALDACRDAGIFVCYNLLVFEPDTTVDDVRENVKFIRDHADHPVNFCRAEPYHGTPLHLDLSARGSLSGSHLGWDYRLEDPRAELLFRITSTAFRQRNFDPEGVANRYMGLGYSLKLLEFFYDDPTQRLPALARRAREVTRGIANDTADFLDACIALAERLDPTDHDSVERETALLGLRIAASDRVWHVELDALYADMAEHVRRVTRPKPALRVPRGLSQIARQITLGASLALWATTAPGCSSTVVDPVPADLGRDTTDDTPDQMVVDPVPVDAGIDQMVVDPAPVDAGVDQMVVDPPPPDAWFDVGVDRMVVDPPPPDAGRDVGVDRMVVDPPPPDAGFDVGVDRMVVDPPPPDAGRDVGVDRPIVVDPPPPDAGRLDALRLPHARSLPLIDQWRDTTPKRARRSEAVALYAPPDASLAAERGDGFVRVKLRIGDAPASTRWEGDGTITGDGTEVRWEPASGDDQLRVAVRTRGGVAVLAMRASDVDRRRRSIAEIRDET